MVLFLCVSEFTEGRRISSDKLLTSHTVAFHSTFTSALPRISERIVQNVEHDVQLDFSEHDMDSSGRYWSGDHEGIHAQVVSSD